MNDRFSIDSHKLMYHPHRVAQYLTARSDWDKAKKVYPIYVEISPVSSCNHRCTFCAIDYTGYKAQRLSLDVVQRTLSEMGSLGIKSVMFAGEGEPLLHKDIDKMVVAATNAGIDAAITSNATLLTETFMENALPRLSWFKASVNAGTPKTYSLIHRTNERDFSLVIANLSQMVAQRSQRRVSCVIGAQILLLPENAAEIERLALICRDEIGLDYLVIKPYSQHSQSITRQYENIDYRTLSTISEKLGALETDSFSIVFRENTIKNHLAADCGRYSHCYATPFFWAYIMANGSVYGCSAYLLDSEFEYGNISTDSFKDIWEGQKRQANFEFIRSRLDIEQCRINCRMDEVNRYLDRIVTDTVPHVNFI